MDSIQLPRRLIEGKIQLSKMKKRKNIRKIQINIQNKQILKNKLQTCLQLE